MRFRWLLLFLVSSLSLRAMAFTLCPSAPCVDYRADVGVLVVPLPPLAAWLGATVAEDPDGRITVTRNGVVFRCRVGDTAATVGDQPVTLPFAPYEELGVIHMPLQPLIAAWGGEAQGDFFQERQVTVSLPNMPEATLAYQPGRSPNGGPNLYLMNTDGSGFQRITYSGETNLPMLTPDGKMLAYYTQSCELYSRRADSPLTQRIPVTREHVQGSLHLLPEEKGMLYSQMSRRIEDQDNQITRANLDGSDTRVLAEGNEPLVSPDGKLIVFTKYDADRKRRVLMCMDSDGGNARPLEVKSDDPVAISPDGSRLLCQGYDGPQVVMVNGTKAGTVYELPTELRTRDWSLGAFSPDGRQIALRRGEDLWIADAELREARPLARRIFTDRSFDFAFTPDGRHIVYHADDVLYRIDLKGQGRTRVTPPGYAAGMFFFTPDGRLLVRMMPQTPWLPASPPDVLRVNGVLMAPTAPLVKLLGYNNSYFHWSKTKIIASTERRRFQAEIGKPTATGQDGKAIALPLPPVMAHGEVYCPLEPLMAALGYAMTVDEARKVVTITPPTQEHHEFARVELLLVDVPSLEEAWTEANRAEVYVTYPTGIPPTRLTYDTEANALPPIFTTDGKAYLITVHGKMGLRPLRFTYPPTPRELTFEKGVISMFGQAAATYPVSPRAPRRVIVRDGGVWVENTAGGDAKLLATGGAFSEPSFTPDGDRIVYLRDGLLYAMLADGSGKTCLSPGLRVTAYAFAPNGMLFFIGTPEK